MKRRLLTLFAKFTRRRAPHARIDFPRQGRSIVFGEETAVVEFDIELGDEIVVRTSGGESTRYRVRGQVTKEHRRMLRQARMLTVVTPRYAVVATPA